MNKPHGSEMFSVILLRGIKAITAEAAPPHHVWREVRRNHANQIFVAIVRFVVEGHMAALMQNRLRTLPWR